VVRIGYLSVRQPVVVLSCPEVLYSYLPNEHDHTFAQVYVGSCNNLHTILHTIPGNSACDARPCALRIVPPRGIRQDLLIMRIECSSRRCGRPKAARCCCPRPAGHLDPVCLLLTLHCTIHSTLDTVHSISGIAFGIGHKNPFPNLEPEPCPINSLEPIMPKTVGTSIIQSIYLLHPPLPLWLS
jgi:hypothetical protein